MSNPHNFPPVEQWPILTPPDCPNCEGANYVTWRGPAVGLDYNGAPVNLWQCGGCCAEWAIPVTRWPVESGPDCPYCLTQVTCWAAHAPDTPGDLWTCENAHEFVLTPGGDILRPKDAA